MRLPAHLLLQLRVGVGVGAVLLAGCDVVDEVKAAIGGETETVAVTQPAEADAATAAEAAPNQTPNQSPKVAASGGLAGKVARTLDEAKPEPLLELPKAPEDTRPAEELSADVREEVPFSFSEASSKAPPRIKPRIKSRPEPKPERDPCPACGRG